MLIALVSTALRNVACKIRARRLRSLDISTTSHSFTSFPTNATNSPVTQDAGRLWRHVFRFVDHFVASALSTDEPIGIRLASEGGVQPPSPGVPSTCISRLPRFHAGEDPCPGHKAIARPRSAAHIPDSGLARIDHLPDRHEHRHPPIWPEAERDQLCHLTERARGALRMRQASEPPFTCFQQRTDIRPP
jgi:hypothetical protein